jgi:hypothetical protein
VFSLPENEVKDFISELENINNPEELLNRILTQFNYSNEELINKYLQLFSTKAK